MSTWECWPDDIALCLLLPPSYRCLCGVLGAQMPVWEGLMCWAKSGGGFLLSQMGDFAKSKGLVVKLMC